MKKVLSLALLFMSFYGQTQNITFNGNDTWVYTDNPSGKQISFWIPNKDSTIRGIFFDGNAGTSTSGPTSAPLKELSKHLHFGYAGTSYINGSDTYRVNGKIEMDALAAIGIYSGHPEFKYVPILPWGTSSAGNNAYGLLNYIPTRTIACNPNVAAFCYGTNTNPVPPLDATLTVPTLFTSGAIEGCLYMSQQAVNGARAKNGEWGLATVPRFGHAIFRVEFVSLRFWEKVIPMRIPEDYDPTKGFATLKIIPYDSGWIADQTTFSSGYTKIMPAPQYNGTNTNGSWVIDKEIATLYQTITAYNDSILWLTIDDLPDYAEIDKIPMFKPGDIINLNCKLNRYTNWKRVEYYRGLTKIGESFRVNGFNNNNTNILVELGYETYAQPFYAVGYDNNDNPKTNELYTVLVFDSTDCKGEKMRIPVDINDHTKPTVPANIRNYSKESDRIKIIWNPSTDNNGIKGYEIYYKGQKVLFTTFNYFSVNGLTAGTQSGPYKVVSVDLNGNKSDSSSAISVFTTPRKPNGIVITNITSTSMQLSWTAAQSATGIKKYVLYSTYYNPDTIVAQTTTTSVTLTNLKPFTRYIFKVIAIDQNETSSDTSDYKTARTLRDITGMEEIKIDNEISVTPVPASNVVNIINESGLEIKNIEIIDLTGNSIKTSNLNNQVFIGDLKQGMYFLKINSAQTTIIKRIIKE